ncbi:MAG: sulfotransferase [Pirellulales bacterium]|nr:sulfotransferase [Pirellulales bacterium]
MSTTKQNNKTELSSGGYKDRFWIPRFWDGMGVSAWFGLLHRNRYDITPRRWCMALIIAALSFVNFFLWALQAIFYGRRIRSTSVAEEPIFVIGHWRSGTTLLHELLVLDSRHTYADTYACFAPDHFLVSGWFFRPILKYLLPSQRPMDNMAAGWNHPQEDEFALCNMGARSPYLTIVFPNRPPQDQEYLDLERAAPEGLRLWKAKFRWFLQCLTLRNPKRLVLKSPAHTCRVKVLLEMFPKARFVHIVRDPCVLFPSTVNLWKRLYRDEGLQVPTCEGLEEHVFRTFERMYEVFERDRESIPPGQFSEVRYEELIKTPLDEMRRIYEELRLGEFERVRPDMENYFAGKKDYKTNRYQISPEMEKQIGRRWSEYLARYGYEKIPAAEKKEPARVG